MATIVNMPRLSPTMEEGVLAKWIKKEGDAINPGDVIAEVETDKANMDFPLEEEGVLLKLLVKEGETVKLGAPVAVLGERGENPEAALKQLGAAGAPTAASKSTATSATPSPSPSPSKSPSTMKSTAPAAATARPATAAPTPAPAADGRRPKASPLARKLAREQGIDLRSVHGSGPNGRIVGKDLQHARPSATAPVEDVLVPASPMRKTIARRLTEAKRDIPHIYLTSECSAEALVDARAQLVELGVAVTLNDLIVRALALALKRIPEANVSFTPDGMLRHGRVDIGIAVSLPDGLITPVVRDAANKPLGQLAAESKALIERARDKRLQPEEYSGGSGTVTNLGKWGVKHFDAIINPPEALILAVGAIEKRAVVIERAGKDEVVIQQRMTMTLSCDHRAIDGVLGARVLGEVCHLLEKPIALVI